ncbi:hypothetical protein AVEN_124040-2-1, partial [Araneus ventricosus]
SAVEKAPKIRLPDFRQRNPFFQNGGEGNVRKKQFSSISTHGPMSVLGDVKGCLWGSPLPFRTVADDLTGTQDKRHEEHFLGGRPLEMKQDDGISGLIGQDIGKIRGEYRMQKYISSEFSSKWLLCCR